MVWVMGAALPYTRRHAARSRSIYVGVQGNMDSATVRRMTMYALGRPWRWQPLYLVGCGKVNALNAF